MVHIRNIFLACCMLVLVSACHKSNDQPKSIDLRVTVLDDFGNAATGATVYLYKSESDYLNDVNRLATATTDVNGEVFFYNLSPFPYYYYVYRSADCASNYFTTYHTSYSLTSGAMNTVTVLINETGELHLHNYSADPYDVYIDGSFWGTVDGHSKSVATAKTGTVAIHVTQASGFANTPKEEDFQASVTPCSVGDVNFP